MDYGNNTKFVKANGIIGRDTKVPVPSSLQRHVYHICGVGDFLNKEKAIQVTEKWEATLATDTKSNNSPTKNIVFQSPNKWQRQKTREGWRLVSSTKVVTISCVKKKDKWVASEVGMTFACFYCDEDKDCLDEKLTLKSKEGGLQELLHGCKRKSEPSKGKKKEKSTSVFSRQLSTMNHNMEEPLEEVVSSLLIDVEAEEPDKDCLKEKLVWETMSPQETFKERSGKSTSVLSRQLSMMSKNLDEPPEDVLTRLRGCGQETVKVLEANQRYILKKKILANSISKIV